MPHPTAKLERHEVRGFASGGTLWRATVVVVDGQVEKADPPLEWSIGGLWSQLRAYIKLQPGWRVGHPTGVPHSIAPDAPTPIEEPWAKAKAKAKADDETP